MSFSTLHMLDETGGGSGSGGGGKDPLFRRSSSKAMSATVRTMKIRDLVDGMGYIYTKTSQWGEKFPEARGSRQSPINIDSRAAEYSPAAPAARPLAFSYQLSRDTDVCNNGHTLVVYPRGKAPAGGESFRLDPPALPKSTLRGGPFPGDEEFELTEFRFHWGRDDSRGSEHTVNGKAFPMELHLIHWNTTRYHSLEEALGKPWGIAIVAIFIQVGREHMGLKFLTENLEDIMYKGRQKSMSTAFNPNCLLPDPMLRDYWTYPGSLTSPPCSENVTWVVLRYPLTVSNAQIEEFRRLRTFAKGEAPATAADDGALVDNFRPVQPLHGRVVTASFPQ